MTFNGLDIFILACFLAITGIGFFNGVTRVTAAIVAIYFGSVFALATYDDATDAVRNYVGSMNQVTGELFLFIVLFFAFSSIFTVMVSRWLGGLHLPRRVSILDNIGGAALGIVVSGLTLTLTAMLLSIMLQAMNQVSLRGEGPMVVMLQDSISGSMFVPFFLDMAPFFTRLFMPWFPGGLPPILSSVR